MNFLRFLLALTIGLYFINSSCLIIIQQMDLFGSINPILYWILGIGMFGCVGGMVYIIIYEPNKTKENWEEVMKKNKLQ